jgi:hypothetical protein
MEYPTPPHTSSPSPPQYDVYPLTPIHGKSSRQRSLSSSSNPVTYQPQYNAPLQNPIQAKSFPTSPPQSNSSPYQSNGPPPIRVSTRSPLRPNSRSSSPLHRSGTPLSPYNASRPKAREGYRKIVAGRIGSFARWVMDTARRHPILLGLATFVPVMTLALTTRMFKGVGGLLGRTKSELASIGMIITHPRLLT